jgi:hypothetical protein
MPDASDTFSTLDDFLLSLADGVTQAQSELARAGAMGPPGRQFAYHLPRVDFELKLNLRVVEDAALSNRYQSLRAVRSGDKHLLFRPVPTDSTASSSLDIAAVVRGAFVAVPANDGLPGVVLRTAVLLDDPQAPVLQVSARNSAGEPVAGLAVELNVDREESVMLSQAAGQQLVLEPGTAFERGLASTDADGLVRVPLLIDKKQGPGLLALVIDAAGRTETLVYEITKQ